MTKGKNIDKIMKQKIAKTIKTIKHINIKTKKGKENDKQKINK